MASRDANTPESISHHTDTISNGTSDKSTIASTPSLMETKTEFNLSNPPPLEPKQKGAVEVKAAKNKNKNKTNADKPLQSQQPAPDPLGDFEKPWKTLEANVIQLKEKSCRHYQLLQHILSNTAVHDCGLTKIEASELQEKLKLLEKDNSTILKTQSIQQGSSIHRK